MIVFPQSQASFNESAQEDPHSLPGMKVATASVIVHAARGLHIFAEVQDPDTEEYRTDLPAVVRQGDRLHLRVRLQHNGQELARSVLVKLITPEYASLVPGSLAVDGETIEPLLEQQFQTSGMMVTDMSPSFCQTVTFQVSIDDCPVVGDYQFHPCITVNSDAGFRIFANDLLSLVARN
jgi:hypothetical protein